MVFQDRRGCDKQLLIKISTDDKERLKQFADELNMPISFLIRLAVNELEKRVINERKILNERK